MARVLPPVLILIAAAIAFYKIVELGYTQSAVEPIKSYLLETVMEFDGHGSNIGVSLALPRTITSQSISDETFSSGDFRFTVSNRGGNRTGQWTGQAVNGSRTLGYTATVITTPQRFTIDSSLPTVQSIPRAVAGYLVADSMVQSNAPEIVALRDRLRLSPNRTWLANARSMFDFVTDTMHYVRYSGTTDALTALKLGEASCGGKSRVMAALARQIGIPARLVGGKILQDGETRATHIWVELWLAGHWVPFCPTNNYFGYLPSHYLILYYGESPVLSHTQDINFQYSFTVKQRLITSQAALAALPDHPLNILSVWDDFRKAAISLEFLSIILMLPFGILVVVFCRNVLGIETFGTFMPALIAIGFRDTGLGIGLLLFILIIGFGALLRAALARLQLLHTPRLAIILTGIVVLMLVITAVGVDRGLVDLARVALFPIVILTLTVERFSLITEEYSLRDALRVSALTSVVAALSFLVMEWSALQTIVLGFPETLLIAVAISLWIGRYAGFRLSEFIRFRHLLARSIS